LGKWGGQKSRGSGRWGGKARVRDFGRRFCSKKRKKNGGSTEDLKKTDKKKKHADARWGEGPKGLKGGGGGEPKNAR